MDSVENAVKADARARALQHVKRSSLAIGVLLVVIVLLTWNIYRGTDKVVESGMVSGLLVGVHQAQTNLGALDTILAIELNTGERVRVAAPPNLMIRMNTEVEIAWAKTERGRTVYSFGQYKVRSESR